MERWGSRGEGEAGTPGQGEFSTPQR